MPSTHKQTVYSHQKFSRCAYFCFVFVLTTTTMQQIARQILCMTTQIYKKYMCLTANQLMPILQYQSSIRNTEEVDLKTCRVVYKRKSFHTAIYCSVYRQQRKTRMTRTTSFILLGGICTIYLFDYTYCLINRFTIYQLTNVSIMLNPRIYFKTNNQ